MKIDPNEKPEPKDNREMEKFRMAREIRREHWRNQYDLGFHSRGAIRKEWVDKQLREEGLL